MIIRQDGDTQNLSTNGKKIESYEINPYIKSPITTYFIIQYIAHCRIGSHKTKSKDENGKFDVDRINDFALLCERSLAHSYAILFAHLCKFCAQQQQINTRIKAKFLQLSARHSAYNGNTCTRMSTDTDFY